MKATIILVICLGILVSGNDPLINKKWDRDEVPLQVFTSTQSRWAFWVQCLAAAIASLAALAMLLACFFKCAKDVCFRSGSSNTDINMRALELMNVDEVPNNYPRQPLRAPDDSATAYLSFNDEMAAHRYPFIGRSRRLKSSCHCTAVIGAEHCV